MSIIQETDHTPGEVLRSAPSTQRMSAEDRKRQIVRVAMELFSQKGFEGTTTKEIAAQAGISEAIIFRHFATKHDLYAAILDEKGHEKEEIAFWEQMHRLAAKKCDRELFETLAQRILDKHREDDCFMRLMLFSALEGHELSEMFFDTRVQETYTFLCDYLSQRIADGAFQDTDPLLAARGFMGMAIHQSLIEQLFDKNSTSKLETSVMARVFTELFLNGLCRSEGETVKGEANE